MTQKLTLSCSDTADTLAPVLHGLATAPVHVLAQDLSGRWWLVGHEFGLSLDLQGTPGVEVSLALSATGSRKAPRVAAALLPDFLSLLS